MQSNSLYSFLRLVIAIYLGKLGQHARQVESSRGKLRQVEANRAKPKKSAELTQGEQARAAPLRNELLINSLR